MNLCPSSAWLRDPSTPDPLPRVSDGERVLFSSEEEGWRCVGRMDIHNLTVMSVTSLPQDDLSRATPGMTTVERFSRYV